MKRHKVVIGTAVMAAANVLRLAAQLMVLPFIARELGPSAYGVFALATPFVFFAMIFADLGLGAALVRAKTVTRELEASIFWLAVTAGAALTAILALLAFPLGRLLGEAEMSPVLLGLCSLPLLASLAIVPYARLQRNGNFLSIAACDLISAVARIGVAVYGILDGWAAWSLVAQLLAMWIGKLTFVIALTRFRPALTFHTAMAKSSVRFGAGVAGASMVGFVSANLDSILVGTFLGTAALGYYAFSSQMIIMPTLVLGAVHFSLFPAIAEAQRSGRSAAEIYLDALRAVLLIVVPAMAGLALTADLLVGLVLGSDWAPVAPLIQLLAPAGLMQALFVLNGALLLGLGLSYTEFQVALLRAGLMAFGIVAGLRFGTHGVAAGISLGAGAAFVFYTRLIMRSAGISFNALLRACAPALAATLPLALGVIILRATLLQGLPKITELTLCIAAGVLIYLSALFMSIRTECQAYWRLLLEMLAVNKQTVRIRA